MLPFQESGNVIKSSDWNNAIKGVNDLTEAVEDLKANKVNRTGEETLQGPLTIEGALQVVGAAKNAVADDNNNGSLTLDLFKNKQRCQNKGNDAG